MYLPGIHPFLDLPRAYGMNQPREQKLHPCCEPKQPAESGDREKSHWRVALCRRIHGSDVDGLVIEREFARSHPASIEKADQNWPRGAGLKRLGNS
jgi:hypothetical protein